MIRVEKRDRVAIVELYRPTKLNAFDKAMWTQLGDAIHAINADKSIRAAIIIGSGKAFCAGIDTAYAASIIRSECDDVVERTRQLKEFIESSQHPISAIQSCQVPVIAAMHGVAYGLGIDIASACDIRYAAQSTRFSIKEVDLGLAADMGTLQRMPLSTGNDALLRELAYTARLFTTHEAQQIGFLSGVSTTSSRETVFNMAMNTALAIAEKSPVAVMSTKKILNFDKEKRTHDSLKYTAEQNSVALQSPDVIEAMKASSNNRKGAFRDSRL